MDPLLAGYPDWLVVAVGTLAAAAALWLLIKILKWALLLLVFSVLFCGIATAIYLFLK